MSKKGDRTLECSRALNILHTEIISCIGRGGVINSSRSTFLSNVWLPLVGGTAGQAVCAQLNATFIKGISNKRVCNRLPILVAKLFAKM